MEKRAGKIMEGGPKVCSQKEFTTSIPWNDPEIVQKKEMIANSDYRHMTMGYLSIGSQFIKWCV